MSGPEAGDWIVAREALDKLQLLLGRDQAKRTLAEHLRDGSIDARATEVWESEATSLPKAWKDPARFNVELDKDLSAVAFRGSKRWPGDAESDWRWPFNKFSITLRIKPTRKWRLMRGVYFRRSQVQAICNLTSSAFSFPQSIPLKAPSKAGRKRTAGAWDSFFFEVIEIAQKGHLNSENFPYQSDFLDMVAPKVEGLERETLRPVVAQIFRKFVSGAN